MIEVATNYGPNPAPPRYVYLGRRQPEQQPEAETPNAKAATDLKHVEWGDFLLILTQALMPFPDSRGAVPAAIEAYDGVSP